MTPLLALLTATMLLLVSLSQARVYERCELVRELSLTKHHIPPQDVATWVCIAEHESRYNTSVVGHLNTDKSGDHGLFQISDLYWCSPPGSGRSCGLTCAQLEDDDIADDVVCALTVHRAHAHRSGGGFSAWTVYRPFCSGNVTRYVQGCEETEHITTTERTQTPQYHTRVPQHPTRVPQYPTRVPQHPTTTTHTMLTYDWSTEISRKPVPTHPTTEDTKVTKKTPVHTTRRIPHNDPHDKFIIDDTGKITRVNDIPTSHPPRSPQTETGFPRRPTLKTNPDPSRAWHDIHHDPRFLDEFQRQ